MNSNTLKNLKTTIAGLLMLLFTGFQVYRNPASLLTPETDAKIAAGVGLIAAADASKKPQDPQDPQDPQQPAK